MHPKIKEIKEKIRGLVDEYPLISDREIGRKLKISPRLLSKILEEMILEDILTEKKEQEKEL